MKNRDKRYVQKVQLCVDCIVLSMVVVISTEIWMSPFETHIFGFSLHSLSFRILFGWHYYIGQRKKPPQIASTSSTFAHLYVWFRFTPIVQRDHARWYHCDFKFYVLFIHLVNGKNRLSFSYLSEFIVTNCKLLALYLKYYIYFIA